MLRNLSNQQTMQLADMILNEVLSLNAQEYTNTVDGYAASVPQ